MQEGDFAPKNGKLSSSFLSLPFSPLISLPFLLADIPIPSTPMTPLVPTTPRPRTPPPSKPVALPPTTPTQPTNGLPPSSTPTIAAKPRALFANGSDSSDDDEAEPNTEYATLRLKLETLLGHAGGPGKGKSGGKQKKGPKKGAVAVQEPEEAGKIRKRMEVVKAMYFFGEKESGESTPAVRLDASRRED